MKQKLIDIDGYGSVRVTRDGYINSKDIHNIGKVLGSNIAVNRLIERKSVLMEILTRYLLPMDIYNVVTRDNISRTYVIRMKSKLEELMYNGEPMSDVLIMQELTNFTSVVINDILKEYSANYNKYSGSRLLADIHGAKKSYNFGSTTGMIVYYNIPISLVLAGVYSQPLKVKMEKQFVNGVNIYFKKEIDEDID